MHELYSILGVSEDDIDIDIRYCITYVLREGILDLSEAWVTVQSSSDSGAIRIRTPYAFIALPLTRMTASFFICSL